MNSRIIAFVDHEIGYRLLEKLIMDQPKYGYELLAVVTTYDNGRKWWPGVADLCDKGKVTLHIYENDNNDFLCYKNVDWFFLLSWKYIISDELIDHPALGVINLHYSLLPEYRGVYPVNWAIIEGKKNTGITYHLVNEEIDGGEIICQKSAPIYLSDTARDLQLRLDNVAYNLFDELINAVISEEYENKGVAIPCELPESYKSRSSFEQAAELDLDREYRAIDLFNLLRGMTFLSDDKNIYVIDPDTGKRIYMGLNLKTDD